ncbi:A-factor biosynthesis protein [Streptomyces triticagri]|uniref:A-factor biosynthesis protein n=1 Tax=Streptomyces triticagri TaxID=2293568 RepID=A0A372M7B9_9ACTN|nr:ScbA/BarX family gamma-butyrolactone biosynthesis protein [Streptomyces triticagri]RFU86761.1 A-factor biosynthesis protein [Streptomyces triticagri]
MSALLKADQPGLQLSSATGQGLFERTVPRTLVHRAAISEVLLTGIHSTGEHRHRIGAQWSRGHSYYGAVAGRWHDSMLLAETIRQAGLLIGHEVLGIPIGQSFVSKSTSFTITETGARLREGPAHVTLDVTVHDVVRRREQVTAYAYDVTVHRDGEPIGTGSTDAQIITPAVYRRLRGDRLGARPSSRIAKGIRPELVGRTRESDVVLGAEAVNEVRALRADPEHPVLFDHPVDHLPGMVAMEAARQAALAALRCPDALLLACDAEFRKYIEFDSPCLVSVLNPESRPDGRHTAVVEFHQSGEVAAVCRVTLQDGVES